MKSRFFPALVTAIGLFAGFHASAQVPEPASEPNPDPALSPTQAPVPMPRQMRNPSMSKGPIEVNGIAAKVNGRVITKNQVSFLLAPIYAQLAAQFPRRGPNSQFELKFNEAKGKVIQELVDRQIILDEFKVIGASIKPHIVDEEVKRQRQELFNGDESKFREELKRNRLTMDGYREMTREKMIVQAMRAQQFSDAPPPLPNEIEQEYNDIKITLRDFSKDVCSFQKIFIPVTDQQNPTATPESQLTLAENLAKQLADGKDFAQLAKENSKDAYADKGGLQEKVPRTDLSPEFASIIFEAPVGKIVGPLMDPQGFTIIKIIKMDYGPSPPLEKVRDMIEERVHKKKTSAQYEHWIESKRKKAMVEIKI